MNIGEILILIQIGGVCLEISETPFDPDTYKRQLVISQFKDKLIEHFKSFNIESIITGVGYQEESKNNMDKKVRRILDGIEEIKEIPKANPKTISKILIPGLKTNVNRTRGRFYVNFLFPNNLSENDIESAKFLVAVKGFRKRSINWRMSIRNNSSKSLSFYKNTQPSYGKIHEIECLDFLRQFFNTYNENYTEKYIKLKIMGRQNNMKLISVKTIILVIGLKRSTERYRRRAKPDIPKLCANSTIYCCMKSFTINPSDLNLQNLISPDRIQLNYCRGECNNYSAKKSNHAIYLSLLKRSKNSRLSRRQLENMRSCCTPITYKKLMVQYREYSNIIKKTEINDMIVENCGCN